jgi:hypothetical protein
MTELIAGSGEGLGPFLTHLDGLGESLSLVAGAEQRQHELLKSEAVRAGEVQLTLTARSAEEARLLAARVAAYRDYVAVNSAGIARAAGMAGSGNVADGKLYQQS